MTDRRTTQVARWKRIAAAALVVFAGWSLAGCDSEFEFPEVEFGE